MPVPNIRINNCGDKLEDSTPAHPQYWQESSKHTFEQQSRRYLGNKNKLTEFIRSVVNEKCPNCRSFADVFAGTGIVGAAFNTPNVRILSNDFLLSNHVCLQTFLGVTVDMTDRISGIIDHLNNLTANQTNYFSYHFGGRYFSHPNARKIGAIREEIDQVASNDSERAILLCALIYAVDKVANTVGHYDAFRRNMDTLQSVRLFIPSINFTSNSNNEIYCQDANELVRQIHCDVLYLDPPYNSRQYSDAYHLLENLTAWNKPAVKGAARKMDRSHLKSRYCVNDAAAALAELVQQASCQHILLSYNNTGQNMDGRSNARITDSEIMDVLTTKGDVNTFSLRHKAFTTGRSISDDNTERVFYCRVRDGS